MQSVYLLRQLLIGMNPLMQPYILKTREKLNKILAERTGQSIEKIQKDTDRDNFLTADEAKEMWLAAISISVACPCAPPNGW
jgi:hypothetical protein